MSSLHHVAITFVAEDRPGLVDRLSRVVSDHQGNWLDSSMARLAQQFAGILLVTVPAERCDDLQAALEKLAAEGITAMARPCPVEPPPAANHSLHLLELVASDRPGIVNELSSQLARLNVNVLRLHTRREAGSMSATPLFRATARLTLPAELTVDQLATSLEQLSPDLQITLPPAQ